MVERQRVHARGNARIHDMKLNQEALDDVGHARTLDPHLREHVVNACIPYKSHRDEGRRTHGVRPYGIYAASR